MGRVAMDIVFSKLVLQPLCYIIVMIYLSVSDHGDVPDVMMTYLAMVWQGSCLSSTGLGDEQNVDQPESWNI